MTRAFFRVSKKRSPVRRPRRGTHLQVERLEDRSLLSANPLFDPASSDALGLLVRFREDVTDLSGMAILEGTEIGSPIAPTLVPGLWEIKLAEAVRVEDAVAAYQANPLVLYAGADSYGQVDALPDDPLFPSLWGLHNTGQTGGTPDADIDAPEAWEVTTGSTRTVVALIDSGVGYNHLDLYKNIWVNQGEIPASRRANLTDVDGDGLITFWDLNDPVNQGPYKITDFNGDARISGSDTLAPMNKDASGNDLGTGGWADGLHGDGNGFADDLHGWDFANNDNNPLDDNGHGTHVAGTIAAVGDNGIGVTGVNWRVQVMLVKALSAANLISTANAIRSLNYAVANAAPVSNNSYSGFSFSQAYFDAIRSARNAGHIFVASAGNTNTSNDLFPRYPSAFDLDYILTVAATDSADDRAAFSSFGATSVDLGAPGAPILSTTVNSTYGLNFGTSMAAPHVTGVVALVRTLHPDWSYDRVINQMLSTVDEVPALQGMTITGGRLNAARAVGPEVTGPRIVAHSPAGTVPDPRGSLRLTFHEPINLASFTPGDVAFTGPDGPIPVTAVAAVSGSDNRQFDLTFPIQDVEGTYTMVIGPDITDAQGNPMDQDRDAINGEPVQDRYTARFRISDRLEPDEFGHTAAIHPYEEIDLVPAAAGVFTILAGADDQAVPLSLGGNTVNFYGRVYSSLFVSSNGLITFDGGQPSAVNSDLRSNLVMPGIAPLWDDWVPTAGIPMVLGKFEDTNADGTADRLIIEWNEVQGFSSSPSALTFQAILGLNTGADASDIVFNYPDLDAGNFRSGGASATVGLKAADVWGTNRGSDRLLVSFNGPSGFVGSGQALRFTAAPIGGEIRGQQFLDRNGNGVKDPREPGLPDRTIYLDQNGNGRRDPEEPATVTGAHGHYAFTGLVPGRYTVAAELRTEWVQTLPDNDGLGPQRLFATATDSSLYIVELDPETFAEVNRLVLPKPIVLDTVGLAFDGRSLFLLNGGAGSRELWELDPDTGAVRDVDRITAGSGNYAALAALGGRIYITDLGLRDIHEFDPVSDTVTRRLNVPTVNPGVRIGPGLAGFTGPNALVASSPDDRIVEIDPATGRVTRSFPARGEIYFGAAVRNGKLHLGTAYGSRIHVFSRDGSFERTLRVPLTVGALGGDDVPSVEMPGAYTILHLGARQVVTAKDFGSSPAAINRREQLSLVRGELQSIVDNNSGTPLADKVEDALAGIVAALAKLHQPSPDLIAVLGNLEGAVGDLQAAVNDGLLDPAQGTRLMDQIAGAARHFAVEALAQAHARSGDPAKIAEAEEALVLGDELWAWQVFKDTIGKFKDALAKALAA